MFKLIGGDYGGKILDVGLVPVGSFIISAGIGEDISFDLKMIEKRGCHVVGIDPTEKARLFIEKQNPTNFTFINKPLFPSNEDIKIYKNTNPNYVSESIMPSHNMVSSDHYITTAITLEELFEEHKEISVLKMDIEGAEYNLLNDEKTLNLLEEQAIPQICCEFHHFCSDYSIEDTKKCLDNLKKIGYTYYIPKKTEQPMVEFTFVNKSCL